MVAIASVTTVFFRCRLRQLERRGFDYHAVADRAGVSAVELWRLREYGGTVDETTALRLDNFWTELNRPPKPLPPLKEAKGHHGPGQSAPMRMPKLSFLEQRP